MIVAIASSIIDEVTKTINVDQAGEVVSGIEQAHVIGLTGHLPPRGIMSKETRRMRYVAPNIPQAANGVRYGKEHKQRPQTDPAVTQWERKHDGQKSPYLTIPTMLLHGQLTIIPRKSCL